MTTIDSIVFDLDGTLWDTCEVCAVAWNRVLRRNSIEFRSITGGDVRAVAGLPHPECMRHTFVGVNEQELQLLTEETQLEDNVMVAELGGELYPGVAPGLRLLATYFPLFIVSNCQAGYIEAFLERHEFKGTFQDFECWGNTRKSKAENLREVIRRNDLKHPVFVGDTVGDHKAAVENQVPFWFVTYGFGTCSEAVVRFPQFEDLVTFATRS